MFLEAEKSKKECLKLTGKAGNKKAKRLNALVAVVAEKGVIEVPSLVTILANKFDVSTKTIRGDKDYLVEIRKLVILNKGEKPEKLSLPLTKGAEGVKRQAQLDLLQALYIDLTKSVAKEQMSPENFNALSESGLFERAEEVLANAKMTNPYQPILRFERMTGGDNWRQLYCNENVKTDVIETLKQAFDSNEDLKLWLQGESEPVFSTLEGLQILDGRVLLKAKELNGQRALRAINPEIILKAETTNYLLECTRPRMSLAA